MGVLWGKIGEEVVQYWPLIEIVFPFGSSYVCANFDENRSRNATVRVPTDTPTDWQTQMDFIISPMPYAIAMGQIIIIIIIIITARTMFMLLSSWHSHYCESSPSSFDECRLSAGWPPTLRPNQPIWAVSPPKDWLLINVSACMNCDVLMVSGQVHYHYRTLLNTHLHCWVISFLANVNSCSCSLYVAVRPYVCLSVVCL